MKSSLQDDDDFCQAGLGFGQDQNSTTFCQRWLNLSHGPTLGYQLRVYQKIQYKQDMSKANAIYI